MNYLFKMFDFESLNLKNVIVFSLIFFFLTIIGTQTHEWAHYIVADYFNFKPILHHSSISYATELDNSMNNYKIKKILVIAAGPLQTMLTGSIGFALIYLKRKKTASNQFTRLDWFYTFLSLFWLRQVFNLLTNLFKIVFTNKISFGGDESKLSKMLNIYEGIIGISTGVIGFVICFYVFFYLVAKPQRINFIVGGFMGSLASFAFWFFYFGKIILP
jgi:hypothetical protein